MQPDKNEPNVTPDPNAAPEPNNQAPADLNAAPEPNTAPAEPSPLEILKDIQSKINDKPVASNPPANPSPMQVREAIKEKMGYTDDQVDFYLSSLNHATAPMREELAWMKMEKKFSDISNVKSEMEEELKAYPVEMRGDPVLLEKVYFMSKGKKMTNNPPPPPSNQNHQRTPPNVVSRRVANDYPGFNPSSDNSNSGGRQVNLTNEQRELSRRMGIKEEDYIEHMDRKPVRDFLTR